MEEEHQYFSDAEDPEKTYAPGASSKKEKASKKSSTQAKKRYLAFIGNLPYSVEKSDLEKLFKDIEVVSIRLLTDKVTNKPRGIAFAEFSDAPNLEKALELHQTKVKGRKVNIELTVGGGGSKSGKRKEKIQAKNQKYNNEREALKKVARQSEE